MNKQNLASILSKGNINAIVKPFQKHSKKSNVSPNNRISRAYIYGYSNPGLTIENPVSPRNKIVNALFDKSQSIISSSSPVSSQNRIVNSKFLKIDMEK